MKRKLIIAGVILILVIIGGVFMFEHKQLEAEKFRKEQERMALYLVNHYEGIKEIKFKYIEENASTGSKRVILAVNKTTDMDITFYEFNDSEDNYVIGWSDDNFDLKEREQVTHISETDGIKITYIKDDTDDNR